MIFKNREEAGKKLAESLRAYQGKEGVIILALPRGGVPIAAEIAKVLKAPLDVLLVRKLGVPGHEELAFGAIAVGGIEVLNEEVVASYLLTMATINEVILHEKVELERRNRVYRQGKPFPEIKGRRVIIVDDGLATGSTMHAAVMALRHQKPAEIIVAVPVAPPGVYEQLTETNKVICLNTPAYFTSVGMEYQHFPQITDEEVCKILEETAV